MNEPHQRTKSGKLRKSGKQQAEGLGRKNVEKKIIYTGIESASRLESRDPDDEIATYLQTPTSLCNYQVKLLRQMARGYGVTSADCVDRDLRRTWNIGAWHVANKLSISINLKQPNISGCWANIKRIDSSIVERITQEYNSLNLSKSTCKFAGYGTSCQVQGRWTPNLVDHLLENSLATEENISISTLNIGQTSLFCWIVLSTGSKYLCLLTKESVNIISRYIPEWCKDITETSSGGSIALKIENPTVRNDATQLSISETGGLQYQGRSENIEKLPEALRTAIHAMMDSIHMKVFLDSLQYKLVS